MSTVPSSRRLKFKDLSLHIAADVWHALEQLKLDEWKLDEPSVPCTLSLPLLFSQDDNDTSSASHKKKASLVSFLPQGLRGNDFSLQNHHIVPGLLKNFNTIDQLVDGNKKAMLVEAGRTLMLESLLNRSSSWWAPLDSTAPPRFDYYAPIGAAIFTFADLKTHDFHYCAAFPAVDLESPISITADHTTAAAIAEKLGVKAAAAVLEHASHLRSEPTTPAGAPFVVNLSSGAVTPFHSSTVISASLGTDHVIVFSDTVTSGEYPGWAARNLIAAVRLTDPSITSFSILSLRGSLDNSVWYDCSCDALCEEWLATKAAERNSFKTVGWVDTTIHKVCMGSIMDPVQLAASSAKLNLGLMKWRMLPELQLEPLQSCKALLLGSGTLGCNIGRHLLMWGVTHITFVDRGYVSYSNPVRQTLFELSDVLAEGEKRCKSIAAANAVKRILPSANATGVNLSIRMPGHRVDPGMEEEAKRDIQKLEELILAHDVVFLLTDSRESRWLPTVLASLHNKPVINSALGFDTFVVMRHGVRQPEGRDASARLGCYFCNDVIAPQDSLTARSLDQQCTVTRPGVSAMASALSVEMLAAIYNHPDRFMAPPHRDDLNDDDVASPEAQQTPTPLGVIPHQLRGNVYTYGLHTMYGRQYSKCTACSDIILQHVKDDGYDFIIQCLNKPDLMEEVTGLKADREAVEAKYANWDDDAAFDD